MTDELKPVPCGCVGEPYLKYDDGAYSVMCTKCGIETKGYCNHFDDFKSAKEYATKDWNRAMSAKDINVPNKFATDTNVGNEIIYCKDCKYSHMTIDGLCKYCDIWFPEEEMYADGKHFCASAEKRECYE